jgi:hypothetical protein
MFNMAWHGANCRSKFTLKFASRFTSTFAWLAICLALSIASGCARSGIVRRTTETSLPSSQQNLPFHPASDRAPDDNIHPSVPPDGKPVSSAPFPAKSHARSLPVGTLITVSLETSLSTARVRPGDAFTATLAEPLSVSGDKVIAAGTPVSGRIESVQSSGDKAGSTPDPGYIRLTLNTITVAGKAISVETSSLFAKGTYQSNGPLNVSSGNVSGARSSGFRIQKGRRLTFRLTSAVAFTDTNVIAYR